MAEFVYWGTWQDSLGWLRELASWNRFTFVIDQWYREPMPLRFRSLTEDVLQSLHRRRECYLYSDDYSCFPPAFFEPDEDGETMIDESRGGPALRAAVAASYEENGRVGIGRGGLSYQSYYEDPNTGELYRPPEALKEDYRRIQRLMRRGVVRRYLRTWGPGGSYSPPRTMLIYIGRDAMRLLETGASGLQLQTRWVAVSDLFERQEAALR